MSESTGPITFKLKYDNATQSAQGTFDIGFGKWDLHHGTPGGNQRLIKELLGIDQATSDAELPGIRFVSQASTDGVPRGTMFTRERDWLWRRQDGPKCYFRGTNWSGKSDCSGDLQEGVGWLEGELSNVALGSVEQESKEPPTFHCE